VAEQLALEQVIADSREEAAVLRKAGNGGQADYVERMLDAIAAAAEDYTTWINEADAMIKSGLAERTLRRRFRELQDCGLARHNGRGVREYRACAVPPRPNVQNARARGKAAA
jgi:hypothetical protein